MDAESSNGMDTSTVAHGRTENVMELDQSDIQIQTAIQENFLKERVQEEANWSSSMIQDRYGLTWEILKTERLKEKDN